MPDSLVAGRSLLASNSKGMLGGSWPLAGNSVNITMLTSANLTGCPPNAAIIEDLALSDIVSAAPARHNHLRMRASKWTRLGDGGALVFVLGVEPNSLTSMESLARLVDAQLRAG